MDTSVAVVTLREVEPLTAPIVAEIVVVPFATLVARPWFVMLAAAAFEEFHNTESVTSWVLLSLNVAKAVNCFTAPMGIVEFAGVTAIELTVTFVTVTEAVPLMAPEVAVTVAVPTLTPVATPVLASIETRFCAEDDQVNEVSNCVLPSSKLPIAVNCSRVPAASSAVPGVTLMDCRWAGTTVNVDESENAPTVAEIEVVPGPTVVTTPELSTVATAGDEEFQVIPLLKSELDPSL